MIKKIIGCTKNIILLIFVLIVWKIASLKVNLLFVPPPERVFYDLQETILNGTLIKATWYSIFMAIIVIMTISVAFDNISKMIVKKIFRWRYIKKND